ncbi:TRAF3-interacting protein 1 isoform X2 [Echeneis naucrates]|uniref:TRAF3-interacting protein 1 isoform X2 n=1 Tax=Echeneis naucrates TaxID=173247 RepID=UPI0011133D85|nr:TRAF3-interacting protein 1 isoform X2 [Echeneis naucrates]
MNAAVVKKTQDTLGKVIKKPPLTEKLLSKPPFRYLHDIFSEVIRTTGFMKGLYGENEMKSDNVKDKESKIAFLQKAIDVVMLVSGEPLAAKPARIVAGHEPEKTNELLQAIAKCCLNKMSSDDAVKRILAGEKADMKIKASTSRSQDKENREGRERHLDREDKKRITERSGSRDQKDPDQPKEQESRHRDVEKEHHRDKERSDKHQRSEQDHGKGREKDKSRDRERDKDRDKGRVKDREKVKDRERDREKEKDKERDKEREKRDNHREFEKDKEKRRDRDKERQKERERHKEGQERNKSVENDNSKGRTPEEAQHKSSSDEPSKTTKPVPAPPEAVENQSDSPARIPRPSSAKGQRRRPKIGGQDESDSEGDGDVQFNQRHVPQESGDAAASSVPSGMASSNRRIARPSSARPAPPRVKRQESYTDVNSAERLSNTKPTAPVIMEGKRLSEDEEDDDEQFLVEEAVPPPSVIPEMEVDGAQELDGEEKHGGLVKKILETKKDYELSPSSHKSKEQNLVSEATRKKQQDMVTREIERLRTSIQTVCRSSLPLGKIMDYIQEDMDAMQAELHTWRRENKEHAQALLQEQNATDQAVEPLKAELAELEQLIKDQQDKICAVRSNILKNEEKIQKMVTGINFSSRT